MFVQVENSANRAVVGQSFGPPFPAIWSVSGNIGTVTISAATHEQMRSGESFPPVPNSFTPFVIQIDLTGLTATSQVASGAFASGVHSFSFVQQVLATTTSGGFVGPDLPPLFCTSQQQLDELCPIEPLFCGQTCTLVPGSAYNPANGKVNLIGREAVTACDGICSGPFDYFATHGDLRLTELPVIPALPAPGGVLLFGLLAASALALRARDRGAAR